MEKAKFPRGRMIKKVIVFILGSWLLAGATALVLYHYFGGAISQLNENDCRQLAQNPFENIMRTCANLYILTYILFTQLPEKIRKAQVALRAVYFSLFYFLCLLIYGLI